MRLKTTFFYKNKIWSYSIFFTLNKPYKFISISQVDFINAMYLNYVYLYDFYNLKPVFSLRLLSEKILLKDGKL